MITTDLLTTIRQPAPGPGRRRCTNCEAELDPEQPSEHKLCRQCWHARRFFLAVRSARNFDRKAGP